MFISQCCLEMGRRPEIREKEKPRSVHLSVDRRVAHQQRVRNVISFFDSCCASLKETLAGSVFGSLLLIVSWQFVHFTLQGTRTHTHPIGYNKLFSLGIFCLFGHLFSMIAQIKMAGWKSTLSCFVWRKPFDTLRVCLQLIFHRHFKHGDKLSPRSFIVWFIPVLPFWLYQVEKWIQMNKNTS